MLVLFVLVVGAALAAAAGNRLACPLVGGFDADLQPISVDCGAVRAKGRCDADLTCRPLSSGGNETCTNKIPCTLSNEACVCTDRFTCQRRIGKNKTILLLCHEAPQEHAKRQEALHPTEVDDDDDEDDDDAPGAVDDDTSTFLIILGLSYLVLLCLALIYVRPGE